MSTVQNTGGMARPQRLKEAPDIKGAGEAASSCGACAVCQMLKSRFLIIGAAVNLRITQNLPLTAAATALQLVSAMPAGARVSLYGSHRLWHHSASFLAPLVCAGRRTGTKI